MCKLYSNHEHLCCKDAIRKNIDSKPFKKFAKTDCKSYISPIDMYGRWNGAYGFCSNKEQFNLKQKDFSIYDHEVCWMLNVKKIPDWCECIECSQYKYQNHIIRTNKLFKRIIKMSGLNHIVQWYILKGG